jgi:hypothetical protein
VFSDLHSSHLSLFLAPVASSTSSRPAAKENNRIFLGRRSGGGRRVVVTMAYLLRDLSTSDPFPAEIESNFREKVLGNVDTLHRIRIPTLSARLPLQPDAPPLSIHDAWRGSSTRSSDGGSSSLPLLRRLNLTLKTTTNVALQTSVATRRR